MQCERERVSFWVYVSLSFYVCVCVSLSVCACLSFCVCVLWVCVCVYHSSSSATLMREHRMHETLILMAFFSWQATRYNYSSEEKLCMVEVISMIKAVQEVMLGMVSLFLHSVHAEIYRQLQDFVQIQLREPLRKSIKHKKTTIKELVCYTLIIIT